MPTLGWVFEDVRDRWQEANDPPPDPGPPPPPRYACPFCHSSFEAPADLSGHLSAQHRATRPYLLLAGEEPSGTDVVRSKILEADVHMFNATDIALKYSAGGQFVSVTKQRASEILAQETNSRIWLKLENKFEAKAQPVVENYDLSFRVYSNSQLSKIDRLFVEKLASNDLRVSDVDAFLVEASIIGAEEYSSALANYVLAVLIRDGDPATEIRVGQQDYRQKSNASLRVLKNIDRPLAQLVSGLVRFSCNDFSAVSRTGVGPLDFANSCLLPLTRFGHIHASTPPKSDGVEERKLVGIVPIDNGSDSVMRWADRLFSLKRWSPNIAESIRAEITGSSCDPLDKIKIVALWGGSALRLDRAEHALEPLRMLASNDSFGVWAAERLKEIEE